MNPQMMQRQQMMMMQRQQMMMMQQQMMKGGMGARDGNMNRMGAPGMGGGKDAGGPDGGAAQTTEAAVAENRRSRDACNVSPRTEEKSRRCSGDYFFVRRASAVR